MNSDSDSMEQGVQALRHHPSSRSASTLRAVSTRAGCCLSRQCNVRSIQVPTACRACFARLAWGKAVTTADMASQRHLQLQIWGHSDGEPDVRLCVCVPICVHMCMQCLHTCTWVHTMSAWVTPKTGCANLEHYKISARLSFFYSPVWLKQKLRALPVLNDHSGAGWSLEHKESWTNRHVGNPGKVIVLLNSMAASLLSIWTSQFGNMAFWKEMALISASRGFMGRDALSPGRNSKLYLKIISTEGKKNSPVPWKPLCLQDGNI